jgi:hypothetical protein
MNRILLGGGIYLVLDGDGAIELICDDNRIVLEPLVVQALEAILRKRLEPNQPAKTAL